MNASLLRTKIATFIFLSGFLSLCLSLPGFGRAIAIQSAVQEQPDSSPAGQQVPEEHSAAEKNLQSASAAAKQPAQASQGTTPNKGPAHSPVSAQTLAKRHAGNRGKPVLQVVRTTSATSAPAVPGVNDFAPGKIVVSNGGAKEIRLQLTPNTTPEEADLQRRQTRNLLFITNENLKRIAGHNFDANQQDMLEQVHNYVAQARAADKVGELQRAQVLASKARQLSDDLAGVRTILKLWPW